MTSCRPSHHLNLCGTWEHGRKTSDTVGRITCHALARLNAKVVNGDFRRKTPIEISARRVTRKLPLELGVRIIRRRFGILGLNIARKHGTNFRGFSRGVVAGGEVVTFAAGVVAHATRMAECSSPRRGIAFVPKGTAVSCEGPIMSKSVVSFTKPTGHATPYWLLQQMAAIDAVLIFKFANHCANIKYDIPAERKPRAAYLREIVNGASDDLSRYVIEQDQDANWKADYWAFVENKGMFLEGDATPEERGK
jgi:hypothetical protein